MLSRFRAGAQREEREDNASGVSSAVLQMRSSSRYRLRLAPHPGSIERAMSALKSGDEVVPNAHREDQDMKYLLTGVAVVAALAFGAPVGAQQTSPSGGNPMGMPGPNPGGPGLTPYSSGQPRSAAPAAAAPSPSAPAPSASQYQGSPPPSSYPSTSATPPKHRYTRHYSHGKMAGHYRGKGPQLSGSTADQLNQEELARLQAGNYSNPSAPSYSNPSAPPAPGNYSPGTPPPPRQPYPPMGTTGGGAPYRP